MNQTEELTYEILGYRTKEDFTDRNFLELASGFTNKEEAVKRAKQLFLSSTYAVVKVQSNDREFIQIIE
ncbi:MAG TPA: hypothetical protein VNX68_10420 [Nitrosopumilaceae archaeon]|nr:hypothetical protein [Nitrosopumilaceae archaeon]